MKIKKKYFIHYILPILFLLFNKYAVSAPLCYEEIESNINEETISEETSLSKENRNNVEQNNKRKNINKKEEDDAPKEIEISADEKIEVDKENGVMIATGNAFVKEGVTSLQADMLTAFSCETEDGDTKIIQVNADNNVIIKSDQGNAFANRGIYFVDDKIIELYDKVKLEKDGDILVGDNGKFNVLTGKGEISVAPGKKGGGKKVYGIIKSKKK